MVGTMNKSNEAYFVLIALPYELFKRKTSNQKSLRVTFSGNSLVGIINYDEDNDDENAK